MQINRQSYEEYFLLYADGELNESERRAVEEFIGQNPDLAGELSIVQDTVFEPDSSIVFENKELLFKDVSDDRKVFYMSWFRIAAAAAVLIALMITGWLYTGNRNAHINQPVTIAKKEQVKKVEQKDIAVDVKEEKAKDVAIKEDPQAKPAIHSKRNIPSDTKNDIHADVRAEDKTIVNEPGVANVGPLVKPVEATVFKEDVVEIKPGKETIDVAVAPRAMDNDNGDQHTNDVSYAQSFQQERDDDMIYFANTSLTKKTKLRGVLRKATRYLDRVTSLQ